jgi:hypothetical protein
LFILPALSVGAALACANPLGGSTPTASLPASTVTATTPARTAQIYELKNDVTARETGDAEWDAASEGEQIIAGGGVRTGDESRVRVDTSEGSIIRIAPNTEFQLLQFSPQPSEPVTRLKLEVGKVWAQVAQVLGFGTFEIETPTGVSTVRGSRMSVEQAAGTGRMLITCLEGQCRLSDLTQANSVDLNPGQQAEIPAPGQPPQPPQPMDRAQFEDWLNNVPEAQAIAQQFLNQLNQATPTPPPPPAGLNLSSSAAADTPKLAFDGRGVLHAVWVDRSYRQLGDDYVHRQLPPGGQWSEVEVLTEGFDFLFGSLALLPKSDGTMCVLWNGAGAQNPLGLFQRCQTNAGWSAPESLIQAGGTAREFSAVRLPDDSVRAIHIVGAGTVQFGETVLSDDLTLRAELVADAAGGFHAAWARLGNTGESNGLHYRASADGGLTWTNVVTLSTTETQPDGLGLNLAADPQGGVHLLWNGFDGTHYRRWTPAGGWGETARLSDEQTYGPNPDLALDPNGLARAVWGRFDGMRYSQQAADGTWSAPRAVTSRETDRQQIAVDAQGLTHVVWVTDRDVYYLTVP